MLKIRNRKRAPSPDGHVCRMCGVAVLVGPDSRCRLGHLVGTHPDAASPPVPAEAPVTAAQDLRSEWQAIEWQAPIEAAEATPAADGEGSHHVAAPEATPEAVPTVEAAPFAHPYDEVLAWTNDPEPGSAATWPADADTTQPVDADLQTDGARDPDPRPEEVAPAVDDLSSVLGELLAWDEPTPSALDVSADELPPAAGM